MARGKKQVSRLAAEEDSKRKRQRDISPQTEQPFEQDSKRRIGNSAEPGEPPTICRRAGAERALRKMTP